MKKKINSKKKKPKEEKTIKIEESLIDKIKESEKEIEEGFQEFIDTPEIQRSSPSLNKINATPVKKIRLEEDLGEESNPSKGKEDDSFKYDVGKISAEEPKYQNYETNSSSNIVSREEIGKMGIIERREVGFINSPEIKVDENTRMEKYNPARRFEKEKLGREDFLKERELKYKSSR